MVAAAVCGVWWRVRLVSIDKNRRRLIKARDCLCIILSKHHISKTKEMHTPT